MIINYPLRRATFCVHLLNVAESAHLIFVGSMAFGRRIVTLYSVTGTYICMYICLMNDKDSPLAADVLLLIDF